jgi:hypothetical protein
MKQLNVLTPIQAGSIQLLQTAQNPIIPGFTTNSTRFENVYVSGKYAYVASNGGSSGTTIGTSLTIYDVSQSPPVALSYLETFSVGWVSGPSYLNASYNILVQNNYAFVASNGSSIFYTIDVKDPTNPTNKAHLTITNSPGSLYSIALSNNYAYLATQNKGLSVVNITDPTIPAQTFQEGGTLNKSVGVCLANGFCYTTNFQTTAPWTIRYLKIWSLANPAVPSLLTTHTLPVGTKPGFINVVGNYAYVSDLNTSSIQIVNISNPLIPVYISSLQASASFNVANNVQIYNDYAYITSGGNATFGGAIDVYDISSPAVPVKITTITQGIPSSVFGASYLYNNILYVADYGTAAAPKTYLRMYSTLHTFSTGLGTQNLFAAGVQLNNIGNSTGKFSIQGSEDNTHWSDIPGTKITLSGSTQLIPKINLSYQYIRTAFTNFGSNGFTATIKTLGD